MLWILQEELKAVPQESEVFSSSLLVVDQLNRIKQDLDQVEIRRQITSSLNYLQNFDKCHNFLL